MKVEILQYRECKRESWLCGSRREKAAGEELKQVGLVACASTKRDFGFMDSVGVDD